MKLIDFLRHWTLRFRDRIPDGNRLPSLVACGFLIAWLPLIGVSGAGGQDPGAPREQRPRRAIESQDDKPFRLTADLVTVITSVTDSAGNQISDLGVNEFRILEDNEPQEIAQLYRDAELPLRLVFLFDISSSIRHRFDFEQRAAARFFEHIMRPGDTAALISISTDPKLEVQLTQDIEELVGALGTLKPGGATALYAGLTKAGRYLRPAEGRKIAVVLSDGSDTASGVSLAQALVEVQRSDVVIYGVHSTGIAPSANVQNLAGEFALKAMSEDTGGRAFFPPIHKDPRQEARELDEIYRRIAAEVRAQYVLTYYSKKEARPGVFRTIAVEVTRPGLQVRARRGYYTPAP